MTIIKGIATRDDKWAEICFYFSIFEFTVGRYADLVLVDWSRRAS